jgi:hypothetical protein
MYFVGTLEDMNVTLSIITRNLDKVGCGKASREMPDSNLDRDTDYFD